MSAIPAPILAIETSCDETSAAVMDGSGRLVAHAVYSQVAEHAAYGGVVPELASRRHSEILPELVDRVLANAAGAGAEPRSAVVTRGPGLVGSLLVGVQYARAWAWGRAVPVHGVHHVAGHLHAILLEDPEWECPYLSLVVSGGHTQLVAVERPGAYRVLDRTRDDAAGEAFDKAAKLLGLGYPGGPAVARAAGEAGDERERLVSGVMTHAPGFSFSGLKTALRKAVGSEPVPEERIRILAASFQDAVVDALARKVERALLESRPARFVVTGGVASNESLRARLRAICLARGVRFAVPRPSYCTDNAAMIAAAAFAGASSPLRVGETADPAMELPGATP